VETIRYLQGDSRVSLEVFFSKGLVLLRGKYGPTSVASVNLPTGKPIFFVIPNIFSCNGRVVDVVTSDHVPFTERIMNYKMSGCETTYNSPVSTTSWLGYWSLVQPTTSYGSVVAYLIFNVAALPLLMNFALSPRD
jgi:hypothetical protein